MDNRVETSAKTDGTHKINICESSRRQRQGQPNQLIDDTQTRDDEKKDTVEVVLFGRRRGRL